MDIFERDGQFYLGTNSKEEFLFAQDLLSNFVKHGQWVNDNGLYKCTACNELCPVVGWASCVSKERMYKTFKYCPNCGAKMDEEEE